MDWSPMFGENSCKNADRSPGLGLRQNSIDSIVFDATGTSDHYYYYTMYGPQHPPWDVPIPVYYKNL